MMHTIYESELCKIQLEEHDTLGLFIHVEAFKWGVSTYKSGMLLLEEIKESLANLGKTTLRVAVREDNVKLMKFVSMFGFTPDSVGYFDVNSKYYDIWVLALEDKI